MLFVGGGVGLWGGCVCVFYTGEFGVMSVR